MLQRPGPPRADAMADLPAEPARIAGVGDALRRLAPALDAFIEAHDAPSYPPYVPGSIGSEAAALPATGIGLSATIDELSHAVADGSRISAPGFVAFITTGAATGPATAAAAVAVAGGQRYTLHAFNALERTGLRWLADLCGLPSHVTGVFTSGGSAANLVALGAARQAAFERRGVDVGEDGQPGGVRCRIYASTYAHRTIHRAAAVLGLGRNSVVGVPADGDGRIRLDELEAALVRDAADGIIPIATVAIAGTTDTGSIDDIQGVTDIARRYGSWVHVDGAYGLVAMASPKLAPRFAGLEDADSWIVDPHKWLAAPVGIGATYVRDAGVLTRAFAEGHAAYLEGSFADHDGPVDAVDGALTDPDRPAVGPGDAASAGVGFGSQFDSMGGSWADQSLELSAPPRGVLVWAILREIGRAGVAQRVERHVTMARAVADRARSDPRLELLMEPQLSITCFRYRPPTGADGDSLNRRILERLRRETPFIPSSADIGGVFAIRPCFINPRTTEREVDGLVDAIIRFGDELTAGL
jgi:aromatic-L-amino-acid decarboxylase